MMVFKAEDFIKYLLHLKESGYPQIVVPFGYENYNHFAEIDSEDPSCIKMASYRTINPPKYLFYFPREKVYPLKKEYPKRIIAGLKACDLKALEILDQALMNGTYNDPAYSEWRKNTTIISSDCTEICKECSCNLFDGLPFAEKGFDINISALNGSYYLTVGSTKGEELIQKLADSAEYRSISDEETDQIKNNREKIIQELSIQNSRYLFSEQADIRSEHSSYWIEASKDCMGCGACTNVCPTCYCIILNDESFDSRFIKARSYDSCQWYGYARVAGGGTPRPKMHQRFRNRYLCKMDYMKSNFAKPGCTGCGRCTEACAAEIDFRRVVTEAGNMTDEFKFTPAGGYNE